MTGAGHDSAHLAGDGALIGHEVILPSILIRGKLDPETAASSAVEMSEQSASYTRRIS